MKRTVIISLAALAITFIGQIPGDASVKPLTLKDLSAESTVIVRGLVVGQDVHHEVNSIGELIVTDYTVRVEEWLKGEPQGDATEVIVQRFGGRIGDIAMHNGEEVQIAQGEQVVLFLVPHFDEGRPWRTHGWFQGKFTIIGESVREAESQSWEAFRLQVLGFVAESKGK